LPKLHKVHVHIRFKPRCKHYSFCTKCQKLLARGLYVHESFYIVLAYIISLASKLTTLWNSPFYTALHYIRLLAEQVCDKTAVNVTCCEREVRVGEEQACQLLRITVE